MRGGWGVGGDKMWGSGRGVEAETPWERHGKRLGDCGTTWMKQQESGRIMPVLYIFLSQCVLTWAGIWHFKYNYDLWLPCTSRNHYGKNTIQIVVINHQTRQASISTANSEIPRGLFVIHEAFSCIFSMG